MDTLDLTYVQKIHEFFKLERLKLSVAESCTAGAFGYAITLIPGSSAFFDSAIIVYSPSAKHRLLGIDKSLLNKEGTVSEDTARAMSEAVRKKTSTDFSIAITGNLGPDPIEDKKPGLVFIAVSSEKETTSRGFIFDGTREEIRKQTVEKAMEFLYEAASLWA